MFRLVLRLHGQEVNQVELEPGREFTFGRGSNCDVVLEPQAGISRSHFRVFEDNGQWTVQVLSKFGEVIHAGQPTNTVVLEPGTVFKLAGYDFFFTDAAQAVLHEQSEIQSQESSALPAVVGQSDLGYAPPARTLAPVPAPTEDFEGNDEATRVGVSIAGTPYLRIVEPSGEEETLKLEGRKWIAGREDGCEILLNDRKASRRQFELSSSPQGQFIRDLGSSNGTLLNGMPLQPDELKPLRSGDVIGVGSITIHFEIRDPNFEKKLMVIPQEVISALPAVNENPYEMINYPVPSGPGGAVRIDQYGGAVAPYAGGQPAWPGVDPEKAQEEKKKKIRFYAIVGTVLAIVIGLAMSGEDTKKPAQTAAAAADPFSRLTPQKQQIVRETYVLARNLFMQGKHDMAAAQLVKLHEILPEGYENSLSIAEECRAAAEARERMVFLEQEKKKQEENKRIVDQNLRQCEPLSNRTMNLDELRSCLAPTYERDPEHPRITEMLSRVQMRVETRDRADAERKDYAERVGKGRALYAKAELLEAQGNIFGAIEAYKKHVDSPYPDPNNLKDKSQKALLSITKRVSSKVDESIAAAESAYAGQNYREAIENIKKAKELDPKNEKAAELNAKIRRELNMKLKEVYEEAIIFEGIGQVDRAKELWKKIIETDHPEGDYYKKAKLKLKAYGSF